MELLYAAAKGELKGKRVAWRDDPALTVVMAAKGYPGAYDKGTAINGLDDAASDADVEIFHAGTALQDGQLVATGGRVLNVTAVAPSVAQAQALAYAAIDKIDWPDGFCPPRHRLARHRARGRLTGPKDFQTRNSNNSGANA